jgi:hypothetical protein
MWRTVLLVMSLLFLPACAPTWYRADTTPQQLARDDYECQRETRQPAPPTVVVQSPVGSAPGTPGSTGWDGFTVARSMSARNYYKSCMRARGYTAE